MDRKHAKQSLTEGINTTQGICETLRLTYDLVHDLDDSAVKEKITEYLIDAFIMGKKMSARLAYYKTTYNDTTGHNASNLKKTNNNRARQALRESR